MRFLAKNTDPLGLSDSLNPSAPLEPTPEWSQQAGCQSRWRKPHGQRATQRTVATGNGRMVRETAGPVSSIEMLLWDKTP